MSGIGIGLMLTGFPRSIGAATNIPAPAQPEHTLPAGRMQWTNGASADLDMYWTNGSGDDLIMEW